METDRIAILTATIDNIPTLPLVVSRVMEITANPDSSAQELINLLSTDPALTIKILKIANSVFYSRSGKIATIREAVMTIGYKEVRNIVLASAVCNNFAKLKKVQGFDAHLFWRHSFVTGLASQMMAQGMKIPAGELFVAGLIHDIGKLAMVMALPAEFTKISKMTGNVGMENLLAEKHVLGLTHEEVGARLLKRWILPPNLVAVAGCHHRPAAAEANSIYPLIVHLADFLAHIHGVSADPPAAPHLPEGCFSAETVSLARSNGIEWHPEAVMKHADSLEQLKTKQASVLDIFLA
ncbi:MAG: HDOD domain-containing protein [Desulfatitalea sp.]